MERVLLLKNDPNYLSVFRHIIYPLGPILRIKIDLS